MSDSKIVVNNKFNLDPCPFCGFKNKNSPMIIKSRDYDMSIKDNKDRINCYNAFYHAVCLKCKAESGEQHNIEKLVKVWNTRIESNNKALTVEQLKNRIGKYVFHEGVLPIKIIKVYFNEDIKFWYLNSEYITYVISGTVVDKFYDKQL